MSTSQVAAAVELHEVSKAFLDGQGGSVRALHRVSLKLQPGRSLALIGPSGCGKSTLLRCLVGGVEPDGGTVRVGGEQMSSSSRADLCKRIGYVVQSGGLFPHLTAGENVTLAARYLSWTSSETESRLEFLRDLVRLPEATLERHPRELSGGQQQRVGLMRALFLDPELLLLDEPLGALDPMIRAELQEELAEIFTSLEKTVCLVTHDLAEAVLLCEEMCLLQSGEVIQRGDPGDLFHHPASDFVRRFVSAQSAPLEALDRVRSRQ